VARIFLSHSSADNTAAVALRDWLAGEGWDDVFLDLDPERGIVAGERWERALSQAANRCEAVLFLVGRAWLASAWCQREFHLAAKLNKRMFGILLEDLQITDLPAELTDTWQLVDLAAGADHRMFAAQLPDGSEAHVTFSQAGLARLKTGLTKAGLDARFFAWPPDDDPDRPPYRGLRPLEEEDAGIFFGREAPTIETLDRLRGLAAAAPPRFLVILGASGAGKSSFLRAGLLPRLRREDRSFLPLPIVRPQRAVLGGETGLVQSLQAATRALGLKRTRAEIKGAVEAGAPAVTEVLAQLATAARVPAIDPGDRPSPPHVVLAIDQGEELFLSEGAAEAAFFLALLRDLAADADSNVIVLVTIRSDSYEHLQAAPSLEGLHQNTLSLPPLPRGAYQMVIEGPAGRLRDTERALTIEPGLTAALLADIESGGAKDALPLLAFTLERLYLEHGGDGDLKLGEYREIGGIRGSIEAAVEGAFTAADGDPAVPRDRAARLALLRRALIPWLCGIDPETGTPRRRVARLSEIPAEALPLVRHLISARLLATDVSAETGEQTIEPSHEALLRQWSLLEGWLEEDFAALSTLEGVKRAARDWDANGRAEAWLVHTAGRLEDAEALLKRDDLAGSLEETDRAYLAAARTAETARRDHELEEARKLAAARQKAAEAATLAAERQRQVARRTRIGLIVASLLALVAAGAAFYAEQQKVRAQNNFESAKAALDNLNDLIYSVAQGLQNVVGARVDAIQSTLETAQATLDDLSGAVEDPDIMESRARMFANFVDTYLAAGSLENAQRVALEGRDGADRLMEQTGGSPAAREALIVSLYKLGDVALATNKPVQALDYYRDARATAEALREVMPEDMRTRRLVWVTQEKTGEALRAKGDVDAAVDAFREALETARLLAKAEDATLASKRDLAVSLRNLGASLRLSNNDPNAALPSVEEALEKYRELAKENAGSPVARRDLAVALNTRADIKMDTGDSSGAIKDYEEALGLYSRLADEDPSSARARRDFAIGLRNVGDRHLQIGDIALAEKRYSDSVDIFRQLTGLDPGNVRFQIELAATLAQKLASVTSDPDPLYKEALAILEPLADDDQLNDEQLSLVGLIKAFMGPDAPVNARPPAAPSGVDSNR